MSWSMPAESAPQERLWMAFPHGPNAGAVGLWNSYLDVLFTLKALIDRLGISRASSQLAACVGTNFNNDGTALYQASAALFFAQASGANLTIPSY